MTGRRKGTPCACDMDPCSCGSSKGKCIRAINNVSPDPNGDFNIKEGAGISIVQSGNDEIMIINSANPSSFIAGNNIELNPSGDDISIDLTAEPVVDGLTVNGDAAVTGNTQLNGDLEVNGDTQLNGDLEVNGDIIQNGAAYETHAQQIYTVDDYIIMRDGAVSALGAGDYSGFQVKKYDGTNDGRLVIDNSGVARVGDVGDEQPLLTRSESGSLTNGNLLQWNGTSMKAVDAGVNTSQIVRGSDNIGSDTKPVKVVSGVATPVTYDLVTVSTQQTVTGKKTFSQAVTIGQTLDITSYMDPSIGAINMLIGEHQSTHYKARLTMNMKNDNTIEIWLQKIGPNDEFLGQVMITSL